MSDSFHYLDMGNIEKGRLLEACIHVICLYNTGERSELEKKDNNKVKKILLDPLSYPLNLHTRPHL